MSINPYIFRAYDIRGKYPQDLNETVAPLIARSYAAILGKKKVAVSHDGRLGSKSIHPRVIRSLLDCGLDVTDIGLAPTPLLYFAVCHLKLDGGISITGSHNPPKYTGLKLQKKNAAPITGEGGIYSMRDLCMKGIFAKPKNSGSLESKRLEKQYINFIVSRIALKKPLKIAIDCGNGSAGKIPENLFKKLGCTVFPIYSYVDTSYPNHLPDPNDAKNMKDLQNLVLEKHADLGFAFDGDADRVGLVDSKGRIISADHILMMLARYALAKRKGDVILEVRTSDAVVQDIKEHGGNPIITRSGHSYILDEIIKRKAVFGGETTGHLYFPGRYYDYDDGIFISALLAELASQKSSFSAYIDSLAKLYTSPEMEIPCPDSEKFKKIEELTKLLKREGYEFLEIDGARISFPNGWALIRASNTTPVIKCKVEGKSQKDLKKLLEALEKLLEEIGLALPKQNL